MVTETIQLPPELDALIRSAAERTGKAKHELMLEALQRGLAATRDLGSDPSERTSGDWRVADLESFGIGENHELSGADVKDWLRANWRPS